MERIGQHIDITRRSLIGLGSLTAMGLALAGCTQTEQDMESAAVPELNADLVPSTTPQFAMVQGTWKDMGAQLAREFPEELRCAINLSVGSALSSLDDYPTLVDRYRPYLDIYDTHFSDETDGKLSDIVQGIAEELELDFWQAGCLLFPASPEGEVPESETAEDERNCSAAIAWGASTADGAKGCISVMDADIDIQDLHYMPTIIFKPSNGYAFMSMNGLFGSVANAKGFAIQSPGGSSDLGPAYGTFPHMWVAAYCATVEEAIAFMGDPAGDKKSWVPLVSDFNMMMCDAEGNACDYEVNNVARNIRRHGDRKLLSPAKGDEMPQEAGTYLLVNNLYLSEPMLGHVLSNVQRDIEVYWDDVEPRYWTVDRVLADAVKNGGITLDTLAQAEGETRYYIPEGWDYDYFPDWAYGRWVPSSIYETLDEDGGLTRGEYYGEKYDPAKWGKPYTKAQSREVEAWAPGWHEPSWSATPKISTMGYWSPTPVSDIDKNGSRDLFDSNTKTVYYMNGSSARTLSNTVDATGTYAIVRFCTDEDASDEMGAIVGSAVTDLKEQLWLAARDMDERGVDIDSPAGKIDAEHLDIGRTSLYQGINYWHKGITETENDDRLACYARALTLLEKGICYAQLAQSEPRRICKDFGDAMVDVENLEG